MSERTLARHAGIAMSSQMVLAVLGLLTTAVLARTLGAERLGAWGLVLAIGSYAALLDLGLGVALVRRLAADAASRRDRLAPALSMALVATSVLGVVAAIVLVAAAPWLAALLGIPPALTADFVLAVRLSGIVVALAPASSVLGAVPAALQRLDVLVRVDTVIAGVASLVQIGVVLAGEGLVALAIVGLGARLASVTARAWIARWLIGGTFWRFEASYPLWTEFGRFGTLKATHQALSQLVLHLDRFLVASFVSVSAVAYYSVALELAQRLLVVQSNVSLAYYPVACAAAGRDAAGFAALYERASRAVALFTFPLTVGMVACAEPLLRLWVGDSFAVHAATLLQVLAVAYAGMALTAIPVNAADALDRPEVSVRFGLAGLALQVTLALLLLPRVGLLGAGLAVLGNVLIQCPWFVRSVTTRLVRLPMRAYVARVLVEPLAPALIAGVVLLLAARAASTLGLGGLVLVGLAGALTFGGAVRVLAVLDAGEGRLLGELPGGRVLRWLAGR